jgi:flagellar motor switch protein FliN/FliY
MSVSQPDADAVPAADGHPAAEAQPQPSKDGPPAASPDHQPVPPAPDATLRHPAKNGELHRILHLEVPVIVRLAEQEMPLERVLDLAVGSIIEFDRTFDADLDLIVGNQPIGVGQAVKVGENFGLQIARIGNLGQKIKAMGGG